MNAAGEVLLAIAAATSLAGLLLSSLGAFSRRPGMAVWGLRALYLTLAAAVAAILLLLGGFLGRDFGNLYVYEHSSRALPWIYTISALWAGNSGSLLLWLLLMTVFTVVAARSGTRRDLGSGPYLLSVLAVMNLFFSLLMLFGPGCNPFAATPLSPTPADGLGLNPVLRNPGMIIHPLALYIGYVALALPFALVAAGLANGSPTGAWIGGVRRWALVGWLFLTLGNVVGAWWAYVTLGWGGYWAWDPVENASLIPWFTATALLHSAIVAERRRRHQFWMASLAAVTFLLTIFGTFLTRTGVATSVHAFAESRLVVWFVVFMVVMLLLAVALIVKRRSSIRAVNEAGAVFSDDSNILYTVALLSVITFFVLWGVVFPPIANALSDSQFILGPGFFEAVTAPLGLLLLALLIICSLETASRGSRRRPLTHALAAAGAAIVVLLVLLPLGVGGFYPVAAFALSAAALVGVVLMFVRTWRSRRRFGPTLVHVGLLLLVIGLAGSWAYKQSVEAEVPIGGTLSVGKLQMAYEDLQFQAENNTDRSVTRATVAVSIDGKEVGRLTPLLEYYAAAGQTWTRVARRTSAAGDVYVALLSVDTSAQSADFLLEYHPLIVWLWIGGGIMSLGALVSLWTQRRRRRSRPAGMSAGQE